jgi:hypothetical protein
MYVFFTYLGYCAFAFSDPSFLRSLLIEKSLHVAIRELYVLNDPGHLMHPGACSAAPPSFSLIHISISLRQWCRNFTPHGSVVHRRFSTHAALPSQLPDFVARVAPFNPED